MMKRALEIEIGDVLLSGETVTKVQTFPRWGEVWIELNDGREDNYRTDEMIKLKEKS